MKKGGRAFTLLEILIVMAIIAILSVLTIPTFQQWRENTINKEANATLKVLRVAQKGYNMDRGVYLGGSGHATINSALKVQLPLDPKRSWNYTLIAATGCCQAIRNPGGAIQFHINISEEEPASGACP